MARIDPRHEQGSRRDPPIGERGPNDLCGKCIENVVVGDDAIWTSNNMDRSVSRIDPGIEQGHDHDRPAPPRLGSQRGRRLDLGEPVEEGPNGGFGDVSEWAVTRIDQATGEATSYPVPAMSVSWGADALWTVVPGRRGARSSVSRSTTEGRRRDD